MRFYGVQKDPHRIAELSALFELDLKRKIAELSMGNRKKVSIVQSLLHNPKLLTRPLTRGEIFFSKLVVVLLHVFLLNIVTALAGFLCIELVKKGDFSVRAFLILSLYTLLLNLLFGAIGLFLSTLVKRAKPITTFSIGLVLFFYFIYTLSKITEGASKIAYLSPFRFVNMDAINTAYRLEFWHLLYFIGISLLLITISFRLYSRRDIYT
jgi:ABC-2 type transport system permease protein